MEKITFGRLSDNDIVFDDQSVSRHHGYILVEGNKVYVVDNDSLNGIFVNGQRIQGKALLSNGDVVMVAKLFKLNWKKYCPVDTEATIRNNQDTPRVSYTSQPKAKDSASKDNKNEEWKKSFMQGAGRILKYILTMVISVAVMALINKWLRGLF